MAIKAVIFDLDGTLTAPYFDFDEIRSQMGLAADAGPVWELMDKMDTPQRAEAESILHYHEQRAVAESTLNPGVKQTLSALRECRIYVGVLTRNTTANAMAVAQKHGLKFDAFMGREDGPVKPDAFGVLDLCRRFGVQPDETIMVGDYLFDIQCAAEAGAISVLLANHANADEFAKHADFTIENIEQILEIINNS